MAWKDRRTEAVRLKNRADIARFILRGHSQVWIAGELGMSEATVSRDVTFLKKQWAKQAEEDIATAKAVELARIADREREAWQAWRKSKKDAEVKIQSGGEGLAARAQIIRSSRNAHKAYLDVLAQCSDQRCKILGLYATPGESEDKPLHVRHSIVEIIKDYGPGTR